MNPKTDGRSQETQIAEREITTIAPKRQGFGAGSKILTLTGERDVSDLKPGDKIITRDTGTAVLVSVTQRQSTDNHIKIKAGSLGSTRPDKDMVVAPDTEILIRDWRAQALFGQVQALIRASRLVDGEFISSSGDDTDSNTYQLGFDSQHILYVDGIEVASQTA